MPVTYTVAVDFNDDGDFMDVGEAISSDIIGLKWRLGMTSPYDSVAPPAEAQITLRNQSRSYSPEYTSADLKPGKPIMIQSNDGTTTRTHFTGFISHIEPQAGIQGARTAVIHAHGAERQLAFHRVRLAPQVNVSADTVIDAILDGVPFRRTQLKGHWILSYTDHMELGTNTHLAVQTIARSLESGLSTFAYVGDTWQEGIAADVAIRQLTEAERGRLFTNRNGEIIFLNRHHTMLDDVSVATFDEDMAQMHYTYGDDLVSAVQVTITPRSIGADGTTLWELESPQELSAFAHDTRRLVARFRDADGRPIGALSVLSPVAGVDFTANTQPDGTGSDKTTQISVRILTTDAASVTLEVVNRSGSRAYLLAGTKLRGTPLYQGDVMTFEHVNDASLSFYGPNMLEFNLPALTSLEEAENLARFEGVRRTNPRGVVQSITVSAQHSAGMLTQVLSRTIFDRITVRESQTDHDADYFIIAEEHTVEAGGTRHHVTWRLENVGFSTFFRLNISRLNQTALTAY